VRVWNNCTQFCKTDVDVNDWSACLRTILPKDYGSFGTGCGSDNTGGSDVVRVRWMGLLMGILGLVSVL
jgi:hypothetical protein